MKWKILVIVLSILIGYNLYDDFDPQQLKGKNVVITGASEGIGEQIAYLYARFGARIMITSRTEANLKKVVERCKKEGSESGVYLYHVANMVDPDAGAGLIKEAEEKLGGIDYLVLNHIIPAKPGYWLGTAENMTVLETTFKINFFAYVRLASAAMSSLFQSRGSIVVVSSVAGKVPQPFLGSYSSSKFALDGFFGGLRQELKIAKRDVSVTMCYVALTNTTNAMTNMQEFNGDRLLKSVNVASPNDVAYSIVRGSTRRQPFVHYPYSYAKLAVIVYNFIPIIIENFQSVMYE